MSESSDDAHTRADTNSVDERGDGAEDERDDVDGPGGAAVGREGDDWPAETEDDIEKLRAEVEEKYDFDNFSPSDMAEMSAEEWEVAFDPDTWITGRDLLDRVEKDLRNRIARREVFAVLERGRSPDRVIAYSDEGWAIVYPDGSVEGEGTVLRDVKPTIALCSMDSYDIEEPPEEYELPSPEDVEAGTGELGNTILQVIAVAQIVAGLGILGIWLFTDRIPSTPQGPNLLIPLLSGFFLAVGLLLFFVVANARLSDRFRAEEYRDRLRAAGITEADRPDFLPFEEVVDTTLDEQGLPKTDGEVEREGTNDVDDTVSEN
jgi:hypothetical protein